MSGFLSGKTSLTTVQTADIAADAITLAKLAGGTDGELITWDASGNPAAVGAGTSGHFLKSQGAGSVPVFAADNKGTWNIIGTSVASGSSSLTITGLDSTYDTYAIAISDIKVATDSVLMQMTLGDSSGLDTGASDYGWWHSQAVIDADSTSGAANILSEDSADSKISLTGDNNPIGNATSEGFSGMYWLNRPGDGAMMPTIHGTYHGTSFNVLGIGGLSFGIRKAVITLDRISIFASSGNLTSGRLTIWGIAHA